jgi:thymidylate synthase
LTRWKKQRSREPRPYPELKLTRKPDSICGYEIGDLEMVGTTRIPKIEAPVAVYRGPVP